MCRWKAIQVIMDFALIGTAGYIAPRHIRAIADTGNNLKVAYDIADSVGRLDSVFPEAWFFTRHEEFDCFCRRRMRSANPLHYTSICTPNDTHASFIENALNMGTDVICEKPLVLHSYAIDRLMEVEQHSGHKAYNILQLRLHPSVAALKERIARETDGRVHDVDLTYITSRGRWYHASWKGDEARSGGIATNIGVHFYDMLQWVFGPVIRSVVHLRTPDRVAGYLELERARVRYFLSISARTLPAEATEAGMRTWRLLKIDGERFEFSDGFTDLHTESYRRILSGSGFRISEALPGIRLVESIRTARPEGLRGDWHPLASLPEDHIDFRYPD